MHITLDSNAEGSLPTTLPIYHSLAQVLSNVLITVGIGINGVLSQDVSYFNGGGTLASSVQNIGLGLG